MSNISGKVFITESATTEWAAYDRLPKVVRRAMQEAPLNYSAVQVERLLRERGLIAAIRALMRAPPPPK